MFDTTFCSYRALLDFSSAKIAQAESCKYRGKPHISAQKFGSLLLFSFPQAARAIAKTKKQFSKFFLEIPCICIPSPCCSYSIVKITKSASAQKIKSNIKIQ